MGKTLYLNMYPKNFVPASNIRALLDIGLGSQTMYCQVLERAENVGTTSVAQWTDIDFNSRESHLQMKLRN